MRYLIGMARTPTAAQPTKTRAAVPAHGFTNPHRSGKGKLGRDDVIIPDAAATALRRKIKARWVELDGYADGYAKFRANELPDLRRMFVAMLTADRAYHGSTDPYRIGHCVECETPILSAPADVFGTHTCPVDAAHTVRYWDLGAVAFVYGPSFIRTHDRVTFPRSEYVDGAWVTVGETVDYRATEASWEFFVGLSLHVHRDAETGRITGWEFTG